MDVFPDNKTTDYRVSLPQPIDLEGEWEAGLYSVSYPYSWYTLARGFDSHIWYADSGGMFLSAYVKFGYYESMDKLVEASNDALKAEGVGDNIVLTFDAKTGKVTTHIKNGWQFLAPSGRMSVILGFGGTETLIKTTTESPYVANLPLTSTIYIYCDIVKPQIVGDTNAKLLRSVPVRGKLDDLITETSSNAQFVPVQTKSFGEVEILLRTDTGIPCHLNTGTWW